MLIAVLLAVIVILIAGKHGDSSPPCSPEDCDTCPFPLCSEEEKKRHTE